MIKVAELIKRFGNKRLDDLREDPVFLDAVSQSGENKALTLSRRYTVNRPRIEIHGYENIVEIFSVSGFSKSTLLFTIERVKYTNEKKPVVYVEDASLPLSSLEPQINKLMGISGWQWEEEKRDKPISSFLTVDAKYHADFQIIVDTLSTYADFTLRVMLNYVYLDDAIKGLAHVYPRDKDQTELTIDEVNLMTLPSQAMSYALQYKAARDGLPYIVNSNHI